MRFWNVLISLLLFLMGVSCPAFAEDAVTHWKVTFPLPGHSMASPVLQKDAMLMAAAFASMGNPTCHPKSWDEVHVINTEMTTPPQGTGTPWAELWTFSVCGQSVRVPLTFTPDADPSKGTTYIIKKPLK